MKKLRHGGFKLLVQGHITDEIPTVNALTHSAK